MNEIKAEFAQAWSGRGDLKQLMDELDRQKATKIDFVADTRHRSFSPSNMEGGRLSPMSVEAEHVSVGEWLTEKTPLTYDSLAQLAGRRSYRASLHGPWL